MVSNMVNMVKIGQLRVESNVAGQTTASYDSEVTHERNLTFTKSKSEDLGSLCKEYVSRDITRRFNSNPYLLTSNILMSNACFSLRGTMCASNGFNRLIKSEFLGCLWDEVMLTQFGRQPIPIRANIPFPSMGREVAECQRRQGCLRW